MPSEINRHPGTILKSTRDKKILILTDRFFPEEFIINDLVKELHHEGFNIEVLTQQPSYPFGKINHYAGYKNKLFTKTCWNDIPVYRIFTIQGYKSSVFLKVIHYLNFVILSSLVLLKRGRYYDKVFIFQTGPLTQALAAVLSKKIYKHKVIIWTLDLWPDAVYSFGFRKNRLLASFLDFMVRKIYSNMDVIAVSSAAFKERIMEYAPTRQFCFVPQWSEIHSSKTQSSVKLNKGILNFSFAGNIGTSQNLERILKGFQLAQKECNEIMLNIFGDGNNLENLKKLAKEHSIINVNFWGRLPQSEMHDVLSQSDVLLISLNPDPLFDRYIPLKFPVYLAEGRPIFAVISGEIKNLVLQHQLGIVSDPADINSIAGGFKEFTRLNEHDLKKFAVNSIALSESLFNKERIISTFKTLLTV